MRFRNKQDIQLFLVEVGRIDLIDVIDEDYEPDEKTKVDFLKKRQPLQDRLKDNRKKQLGKENWRRNRRNLMKGIKDYHKSSNGKQFHRKLSRFLTSREGFKGQRSISTNEAIEIATALSSLRTDIYVSSTYYRDMHEAIEFDILLEEIIQRIPIIEKTLLTGSDISVSDKDFLLSIIDERAIVWSMSQDLDVENKIIIEKLNSLAGTITYDKLKSIHEQLNSLGSK